MTFDALISTKLAGKLTFNNGSVLKNIKLLC